MASTSTASSAASAAAATAADFFDFADELALISSALLKYRIRNRPSLAQDLRFQLEDLEAELDRLTAQVRADGIGALTDQTAEARADLKSACDDAQGFLNRIKKAERAVGVITAVLQLATAVVGRNAHGVLDGIKGVRVALG